MPLVESRTDQIDHDLALILRFLGAHAPRQAADELVF